MKIDRDSGYLYYIIFAYMKILMLLDREFPPDLRVENEIEALTTEGHHVFLACYTRKNFPLTEQEGNFTILRHSLNSAELSFTMTRCIPGESSR